jgi:DNA-binding protein H-NS
LQRRPQVDYPQKDTTEASYYADRSTTKPLFTFAKSLYSTYTGTANVEIKMPAVNLSNMDVNALLKLRGDIDDQLTQRRASLQKELQRLDGLKGGRGGRSKNGRKGRKVEAKYRSRKDPALEWAGRGAIPRWMRDEMKGTKLKKEAFLIKR